MFKSEVTLFLLQKLEDGQANDAMPDDGGEFFTQKNVACAVAGQRGWTRFKVFECEIRLAYSTEEK